MTEHRKPFQGDEPAASDDANNHAASRPNDGPADQAGSDAPTSLREQLEREKERADTNYANWQRTMADFVNFKRRAEQEREENARYANMALILNVLPAVDDLERALQHVDPELAETPWIDGIRQIQRKLKGALTAAGVTEISAEGEMFDPNLHEAIGQTEGEEGRVVSEAQRGYRLGTRVIRPAMVVVGHGKGKQ